jgi:4-hydroxy-tetrahydrodipicolinate reductase
LIIGTTGQDNNSRQRVANSARKIPIVFAPNFSVGVNALFWLTRKAVEILGPEFDLEVVEMHHRLKKDAPSGTAKRLAEILAEVRGLSYEGATRHGRTGMIGERTSTEIGLHALRGGDVVGDHIVIYANVGERLELTHRASSRETFAKGALRAAKWATSQPPGLYDMQDVLGLK